MEEIVTMKVKVEGAKLQFSGAILEEKKREQMEYWQLIKNPKYKQTWSYAYGNELGWLAQRMPDQVEASYFLSTKVRSHQIDRDVTYVRIVCNYRRCKAEPNQTRPTVCGGLNQLPQRLWHSHCCLTHHEIIT